jgi:hypothetical protein
MKLYLAIKNNDYYRVVDILRHFDLARNEFFDDKATYISVAILSSKYLNFNFEKFIFFTKNYNFLKTRSALPRNLLRTELT